MMIQAAIQDSIAGALEIYFQDDMEQAIYLSQNTSMIPGPLDLVEDLGDLRGPYTVVLAPACREVDPEGLI